MRGRRRRVEAKEGSLGIYIERKRRLLVVKLTPGQDSKQNGEAETLTVNTKRLDQQRYLAKKSTERPL